MRDLQLVCHQQDNQFYWTERWTEVEKEIKACVQNYLQTQPKMSEFFLIYVSKNCFYNKVNIHDKGVVV